MKQLLFLFLSLLSLNSFGQNCDELFAKKVDTEKESVELINEIIANIKKFENCGVSKEDIDLVNFESSFLKMILLKELPERDKNHILTYGWLFERLKTFVDSEMYQEVKPMLIRIKRLYEKEADVKSWAEDRAFLEQIGVGKIVLDRIEMDLADLQKSKLVYEVVLKSYQSVYDDEVKRENDAKIDKILKSRGYVPFQDLLIEANKSKKPLILFFTGYGNVNSVRMIDNILLNEDVYNNVVSNYFFVSIYTDDVTFLPEKEWVEQERGSLIKTVGRKNAKMQMDILKVNHQPYFAIFDKGGKVLKVQGKTLSVENFLKFLNLEN